VFDFLKRKLKEVFSKVGIGVSKVAREVKAGVRKVKIAVRKDVTPELENVLIEAGVSLEVVDTLIQKVKKAEDQKKALKEAIRESMKAEKLKIGKKPYVIMFVGINGTGKTTSLAKLAFALKSKGKSVVVAAGDTFRAAAIEQLGEHCEKIKVEMISHKYGSDPAAVAFDAIEHAKAKGIDVVMIDTSGRLHVDTGLMRELEKVKRVAKPDLCLLVVDSTTGNDAVEQARAFAEITDGFVMAKFDVDERGGAVISISAVTGKPIYFVGTGQDYRDLREFDPEKVVKALGF
jgi:fused signal recognition particle receptor